MAKNFYTQEETLEKLDMTAAQLKDAVQNGQLREFRDGSKITYKASEVDKIAAAADSGDGADSGLSGSLGALDMLGSGELDLEGSGDTAADSAAELRFADEDDQSAATPPGGVSPPGTPADAGASGSLALAADESVSGDSASATGTGELVLEPTAEDDSGIKLGTGVHDDMVSLEDTTAEDAEEDDSEGTVVTSIGVSVFDEDEVEQEADPLAQTVVSGSTGALGIDGVGSGSGLLDLTRESDDTSLGAELLDEIYPGDESEQMGEATRAGLEEAIAEPGAASAAALAAPAREAEVPSPVAVSRTRVEFAPDPISTGLTGMLFVGILVMCIAGLTTAAATQDVWPTILQVFHEKLWIVGAGSLGASLAALGIGFFIGKRSGN